MTQVKSSGTCRALNGRTALKRIVEVLALRVLARRSIFDTPGRELPPMNDRKMRFLWEGTKIVCSVFVRNYRDLVAVVTSGEWLNVTRDTVNFIILSDSNCVILFRYLRHCGFVSLSFVFVLQWIHRIFCIGSIFIFTFACNAIKILLVPDISEINEIIYCDVKLIVKKCFVVNVTNVRCVLSSENDRSKSKDEKVKRKELKENSMEWRYFFSR